MDNIKILYVEDEPFLGRIVKESLESRGFIVNMIPDGSKALRYLDEHTPDIAVLDVMLPGKDGYSLSREIKMRYPFLPVIFLTAKNQTEDVIQGFQAGGNDYLKKPFSMEELIIRIKNLIHISGNNLPKQNPHEILTMGSCSLFTHKYEIQNGHDIFKISYRENELLKLIFLSKNKILDRKEILLKIWGDDNFYNSRNLDVYITKIREYFKKDPSIQIHTIRGVGYHIIVQE
ncbi:MAG TPA: response regulator transcription factor [Saprospiraceae bacterium]|nr:response regulator transcription factor [Saprospiraceae bacterium]